MFDAQGRVGAYKWQTYSEVKQRIERFGSGLSTLGLKRGDSVGIMSPNRAEWLIADFACTRQGFISVPLYDTLGPQAVEYILNHASVRAVVVCPTMISQITAVQSRCPTTEFLITMNDNLSPADQKILSNQKGECHFLGLFHANNFATRTQVLATPTRLPPWRIWARRDLRRSSPCLLRTFSPFATLREPLAIQKAP